MPPASFQHFVNDSQRESLDVFCTACLDDSLIYSDTLEEHKVHVRKVLEAFDKAGVHLKPEKREFQLQETEYLGLLISPDGIKSIIREWGPKEIKGRPGVLRFANFCPRLILNYSKVVPPLTALTRNDIPFV